MEGDVVPWHWEPCAPRRLAWGWGSSRRVTAAPSQLLQRTLPIHPRPPWAEMLSLGTESGSKRPLSCDSRWGQGSWSKGTFAAQGSPGASLSEDPKPHPPSRISRQPYSCSSPLPPGAQQSLPSTPSLTPFLLGPTSGPIAPTRPLGVWFLLQSPAGPPSPGNVLGLPAGATLPPSTCSVQRPFPPGPQVSLQGTCTFPQSRPVTVSPQARRERPPGAARSGPEAPAARGRWTSAWTGRPSDAAGAASSPGARAGAASAGVGSPSEPARGEDLREAPARHTMNGGCLGGAGSGAEQGPSLGPPDALPCSTSLPGGPHAL